MRRCGASLNGSRRSQRAGTTSWMTWIAAALPSRALIAAGRRLEAPIDRLVRWGPIRGRLHTAAVRAWQATDAPLILCYGNINRSPFAAAVAIFIFDLDNLVRVALTRPEAIPPDVLPRRARRRRSGPHRGPPRPRTMRRCAPCSVTLSRPSVPVTQADPDGRDRHGTAPVRTRYSACHSCGDALSPLAEQAGSAALARGAALILGRSRWPTWSGRIGTLSATRQTRGRPRMRIPCEPRGGSGARASAGRDLLEGPEQGAATQRQVDGTGQETTR